MRLCGEELDMTYLPADLGAIATQVWPLETSPCLPCDDRDAISIVTAFFDMFFKRFQDIR